MNESNIIWSSTVTRRVTLALACCLTLLGLPQVAVAQSYPARPIRLVVPFGAGTSTDIVARVVGDGLSRALGQPVVVDNRAGAGGMVGVDLVAKAAADGYTLVLGTVGTHAINASLYKKLPYDPVKDFVPLGFVGYTPTLLVVAANSPVRTVKDLAARAAQPGGVNFASAGNGTSGHLAGEMLKLRLGGEMVHVPYKDGAQALTDVMSGQVQFMFYHPAAVMPHVRSGRLRVLGVSSQRRSAAVDVAPLMEQGMGDFDVVAWFMLYGPAGMPASVTARLRDAVGQVLASADVQTRLSAQGIEARAMNGDELVAFGRNEIGKWSEVVRRSGAQID